MNSLSFHFSNLLAIADPSVRNPTTVGLLITHVGVFPTSRSALSFSEKRPMRQRKGSSFSLFFLVKGCCYCCGVFILLITLISCQFNSDFHLILQARGHFAFRTPCWCAREPHCRNKIAWSGEIHTHTIAIFSISLQCSAFYSYVHGSTLHCFFLGHFCWKRD